MHNVKILRAEIIYRYCITSERRLLIQIPLVSKKTENCLEGLVIASSQVNHQRVQERQRRFFVQLQPVRTVVV